MNKKRAKAQVKKKRPDKVADVLRVPKERLSAKHQKELEQIEASFAENGVFGQRSRQWFDRCNDEYGV